MSTPERLMLALTLAALLGLVLGLERLLDAWAARRDPDRVLRAFLDGRWWR